MKKRYVTDWESVGMAVMVLLGFFFLMGLLMGGPVQDIARGLFSR